MAGSAESIPLVRWEAKDVPVASALRPTAKAFSPENSRYWQVSDFKPRRGSKSDGLHPYRAYGLPTQ